MATLPDPSEFVHPREARDGLTNLFPSEHSLKWFIRQNRCSLAAEGAAIIVGERLLLHPGRFRNYVLRAGLERAGSTLEVVTPQFAVGLAEG